MSSLKWDGDIGDDFRRRAAVVLDASTGALEGDHLHRLLERAGDRGRDRWESFGRNREGVQAIVVDLVLHMLLERLTSVPSESLRFETGPHGKPFLVGVNGAPHFNVAHSSAHGLIAISHEFDIGVDVETIGDFREGVARRILPPTDLNELASRDNDARDRTFYGVWVTKEACVKATGAGLSTALRDVQVPLDAGEGRWGTVWWQRLDVGDSAQGCVAIVDAGADPGHVPLYSVDPVEALALDQ
jgi:phosphopantetheinyl transferase